MLATRRATTFHRDNAKFGWPFWMNDHVSKRLIIEYRFEVVT